MWRGCNSRSTEVRVQKRPRISVGTGQRPSKAVALKGSLQGHLGPVFTNRKTEILPEIFGFEIFGFIENFGFETESFGYFQLIFG
jgi:hypothetical protein